MRLSAEKALRDLMTANNVTLQSALVTAPAAAAPAKEVEPVTAPVVTPVPVQTSYLIPAVIASILLLAGAGLALRRRTVNHPTM
jgi:hypothetical protein